MTPQQPRFSRRFLTILIVVTSIAIALLSRLENRSADDADATAPDTPPTSAPETDMGARQPAIPNSEPGS